MQDKVKEMIQNMGKFVSSFSVFSNLKNILQQLTFRCVKQEMLSFVFYKYTEEQFT